MNILEQGGQSPQENLSPVMVLAEEAMAKSKAAMEAMAACEPFSPEWEAKEVEAGVYSRLATDLKVADDRHQAGLIRLRNARRAIK